MRHAILITAHRNFDHLLYLVRYFDADFDIYIHIDKKSRITPDEIYQLRHMEGVCGIYRKYSVNWGGYRFLKTILFLVKQVVRRGGVDYVHLISGSDIPIKKLSDFKAFFEQQPVHEYLENFSLPSSRWSGGGLNRLRYYQLNDFLNLRVSKNMERQRAFFRFQDKWHIRRSISSKLPRFYGGGNWWSLSWECLSYVAEYTRNQKRLLKRLKFTFASDEIYFQTVIMNSPYAGRVVDDHMRYIDWRYRNGNMPANLDLSDFEKIVGSPYLFARKIEYPVSMALAVYLKKLTSNE